MRRYSLFLSIFIASLIFGQNYVWPTHTGKQLTSNFGEFRDNHFHMGLDIRTNASVGHPIYAVADGYIHRIATNFGGYGKALYLKTMDGNIALYGHLQRYTNNIEKRLYTLQNDKKSYYLNQYFTLDEYPVKRGEIVGYSGNSGGSMGPHLHFEIRNASDQPLNPKTNGFAIKDLTPPQFRDLALIQLETGARINDSPLPQNYNLLQVSSNKYTLPDTVIIKGKFGVSVKVLDKIQNASYSYQIEKIEMYIDSNIVYAVGYNLLDFSEGKHISTIYGQPINNIDRDDFQKLYRLENYPKLLIHSNNYNGILDLSEGLHKVEIVANDAAGNNSILTFNVKVEPNPDAPKYMSYLKLTGYSQYVNSSASFKPKLIQLEKGVIFQLQLDLNDSTEVVAFIENNEALHTFPLTKLEKTQYVSNLLSNSLFMNVEKCGFLFYSDFTKMFEFDFIPKLILPKSEGEIFSKDSLLIINIDNSFYDTTLTWIRKLTHPLNTKTYNRKSNIYEIFPYGIPYKNKLNISFKLNNGENLDYCCIYSYNDNKSKWNYINSRIDSSLKTISANLNKPAVLAVLKDMNPPWFISTYPKNHGYYAKESFKKVVINIDDDLSGINSSEKYLQVHLDGDRLWVAYQPMQKRISYTLRNLLAIGEHNLKINISDRSGNSTSKSIKFFIE